jgi:AraC-like DNA-binding protein
MAQTEQRWRDLLMCDLWLASAQLLMGCLKKYPAFSSTCANQFQLLNSMPGRSTILSNYPVLRSSDPAVARDRLFNVYGANSFDVRKPRGFAVNADHVQFGGVGLSYVEYAGDVSVGFGEVSFVRQCFSIEGAARYTTRRQSEEIGPGSWSRILPAYQPLTFDFPGGYRQIAIRIEFDVLLRNLSVLLNDDIGQNLVFTDMLVHPAAMEALRRRVFHLAIDYNERGATFSSLAAAEVARMLVMKFLLCHRHNYTHLLFREPLQVSSSTVKAVEEFIEANWDKPIDIEAMVAVAQVSARSLFRQFRKDRGCSPADFAKRVRLNRAREILERSRESGSVIQVALKCGFQNPGHFARDYRNAFGELPSATLQRARKWLS